jgi:predicted TIM-barrel fold metal-dependent hydrolase
MERNWDELLLREYRPEPMVRLPVHEVPHPSAAVVDVHNHLGRRMDVNELVVSGGEATWLVRDVGALVAEMDAWDVETIVNLDGDWGGELEANLDRYDRAYPGRFATFCRLDWDDCRLPGWPGRFAGSLRDSVERGAAGLKVWKDVGLHVRDEAGRLVLCDDERLAPVWEVAAQSHLPVLVHIADPAAFFEPLDEKNERLEQLLVHPEWHFADPRFPRFQVLIDAFEHLVAGNPEVTFIGAHVGCNAEDLAWVGRMLDTYPNFYVDIAARVADLGRQPRATRRLIMDHPARILFGTDAFPPSHQAYALYFRFLETDDECFAYSGSNPPGFGRWTISGVHLPGEVLADVYGGNARRIIPALYPITR